MTSDRIARDYLQQARGRRIALVTLFASGVYTAVVRESQEIVELVLKGALRFVGVDPPKRHDVHRVAGQFIDRFPGEWRRALGELEEALNQLAEDRGPRSTGTKRGDPCVRALRRGRRAARDDGR